MASAVANELPIQAVVIACTDITVVFLLSYFCFWSFVTEQVILCYYGNIVIVGVVNNLKHDTLRPLLQLRKFRPDLT